MRSPLVILIPFVVVIVVGIALYVGYTSYNNFFIRIPETHQEVRELKVQMVAIQQTLDEIVKRLK
jgi:Tfp pilus assembly protein PilE